jgi:type III restriction enzyme
LKNDILEKDENGFFPDQNYLFMAFSYYEKNDKNFSNLIRKIKLNFASNKCLNVNDYTFNGEKQNLSNFKKEQSETIRQENILNSLENNNNEIRVIFAVNKLNEGWDVLNLYDIVRLYDTRDSKDNEAGKTTIAEAYGTTHNHTSRDNEAGKTTIAEAQLIGRGARYYPFRHNSDNKYKRKFDNDDKNPLKLLETLHYHSVYNSRYISELRIVLVKSGIVEETKTTKPVKLKEDFRNSDLYKNGIVFVNDKKKTNYSSYRIWDDLSIVKGINFEYTIYSGRIKESLAISSNKLESEITYKKSINYRISNITKNVINGAILDIRFFNFNNLKKYIKDIDSINNFIEQYLYKLEITLKGLESDLNNITLVNQYDIILSLLSEIEKELKDKITEYQGTKEFKGKKLNEIFKDKELNLNIIKESSIDDMKDFLKNQNWFVYDSNYGTSEEQSFIRMLSKFIDELNRKYVEVKLIRNERDLSIYDFDKGRRFEPDFILILKDKNNSIMNYQVFIEPKGNHLKNNEKEAWKIKFLDDIRKMFKDDKSIIQHKGSNYKLIGLPFYNSSEENKFREVLKEELL